MSILKDEGFELHFKRKPNSWFFDIYSDVGLKDCQADMSTEAIIRRIRLWHICSTISLYFTSHEIYNQGILGGQPASSWDHENDSNYLP